MEATMIRLIIAVLLLTTQCNYSNAATLDCVFEMYTYETVGSVYTCTGRIVLNQIARVSQIVGVHMTGKSNFHVQALRMNSRDMTTIPENIDYFFPNIKAMNFGDNAISHINNSHLSPFTNLQFLHMYNNRVTSLDSNLFAGLEAMTYINFEFNRIMNVGHDFILPLFADIRLYGNLCISEMAKTPDTIKYLKFLLSIRCPPTISHIENSLESRPNLLTKVIGQVKSLEQNNVHFEDKMYYLELRLASLEATIEGLELQIEQRDQT